MSAFTKDEQSQAENKRYTPRWSVKARCMCHMNKEGKVCEDHLKDVSCSGACLEADECPEINEKVDLKLFLSEVDVVKVCATVVWTKAVNSHHEIGVHFFNATSEAQEAILRYATNINKESLASHWFEGWGEGQ